MRKAKIHFGKFSEVDVAVSVTVEYFHCFVDSRCCIFLLAGLGNLIHKLSELTLFDAAAAILVECVEHKLYEAVFIITAKGADKIEEFSESERGVVVDVLIFKEKGDER